MRGTTDQHFYNSLQRVQIKCFKLLLFCRCICTASLEPTFGESYVFVFAFCFGWAR